MKLRILILAFLIVSCNSNQKQPEEGTSAARDEAQIQEFISSLHQGLARAYNEGGVSTDSLIDVYFDKASSYVAPWGWTEPIDSTKARLKNAVSHVKDYNAHVEALRVKSYGTGAYAYFILRQTTSVDGMPLDEYLPTTFLFERRGESEWKIVHAHRSTDYQTFEQWIAMQKKKSGGK